MSRTFYLDLDRTLFRTDMAGEIVSAIAAHYLEKPALARGYSERERYYTYPFLDQGDTKTYFHDVTRWLGDNEVDAAEVYAWLESSSLADGRFENDGVKDLVASLRRYGSVKILTFGEDAYQRVKAALCPSLKGVEIVTTLEPKGEYLAQYGITGDWLLDDKNVSGLPEGVRLVQIDHTGLTQGQVVVSSLAVAKEVMERALTN